MKEKLRHGAYFLTLLSLTILVFIISFQLTMVFVSMHNIISYMSTAIIAYLLGHISANLIEKTTHKEKREVLAGTFIPLPTVIGLTIFIVISNNIGQITSLNSIYISMLYFICFNIPFLVYIYEHEKHKHHLIGFFFAPMFLALVYTVTFLVTSIVASYSISPLVEETLTTSVEYTAVSNFVEDCIKITAKEKIKQGYTYKEDIESYIKSNLNTCIDDFKAFGNLGYEISAGDISTDSIIGTSTIAIKVQYPITIKEKNKITEISKFEVMLSLISS